MQIIEGYNETGLEKNLLSGNVLIFKKRKRKFSIFLLLLLFQEKQCTKNNLSFLIWS